MTPDTVLSVLATVGTDHHPFNRLVDWLDRWLERVPAGSVAATVQVGTSRAPLHAGAVDYLAFEDLQTELRRADVVVCHGGPVTIAEARLAGHRPLVVPRRASLGEHVDDHQEQFAARIAATGAVLVAPDYLTLASALDRARSQPDVHRRPADAPGACPAVERFALAVDPLLRRRNAA